MRDPEPTHAAPGGSDAKLPIANERDQWLVAVHPPGQPPDAPPDFALVVALARDARLLLVHNRRRGVWELPGGWIDVGETAAACALRELAEESWHVGHDVALRAWVVLAAGDPESKVLITGAVFAASIDASTGFVPGHEISATGLWTASALPDDVSAIDAALIVRLAGSKGFP